MRLLMKNSTIRMALTTPTMEARGTPISEGGGREGGGERRRERVRMGGRGKYEMV